MTDETYTMTQTIKERRAMRDGARARKCGSRSKRCTLPSDSLTPAQKRKLNSPVETVNLNAPMTYGELVKLSPSLQFLYLDHLVNEFKARQQDLIAMLQTSDSTAYRLFRGLPGKLIFKGKPRHPAPEWETFMTGTLPPPSPDDPDVLPATPDPDPEPEPAPDPDPRPKKVDVNPPQPFEILSGGFTVRCNLVDLIKTLAPLIDGDQSYTFSVSFSK